LVVYGSASGFQFSQLHRERRHIPSGFHGDDQPRDALLHAPDLETGRWTIGGNYSGDTAAVTALLDLLLHHAHVLKCGPRISAGRKLPVCPVDKLPVFNYSPRRRRHKRHNGYSAISNAPSEVPSDGA
jgi:hypothetical protein